MKNIADDLALAQSPADEEDLIVHILGQLGDDYTHIASALKIRDTPIKYPDLFDKLLDHERTLKDTHTSSVIAIVNSTHKFSSRNTLKSSCYNRNSPRFNNNNSNTNYRSNSGSSRPPGKYNGGNNYNISNINISYC